MDDIFPIGATSKKADWLVFLGIILLIGLVVAAIVIWATVFKTKTAKAKRKRRRRHHKQHNPTLAETGGLPPVRDPNQPPPGL